MYIKRQKNNKDNDNIKKNYLKITLSNPLHEIYVIPADKSGGQNF